MSNASLEFTTSLSFKGFNLTVKGECEVYAKEEEHELLDSSTIRLSDIMCDDVSIDDSVLLGLEEELIESKAMANAIESPDEQSLAFYSPYR